MAFSVATTDELKVEYALILGWLRYEVPFAQWRLFEAGKPEKRVLQRLKLGPDYEDARTSLGAVLYQARVGPYFSLPKLKPMFLIRPRSATSMQKDVLERKAVMNTVGLG